MAETKQKYIPEFEHTEVGGCDVLLVWLVTYEHNEQVVGVFSSKERAEHYIEGYSPDILELGGIKFTVTSWLMDC